MSIADSSGVVHDPTSIDTWRTTLNAVIDDVQECVLEGNGAGGMRYANRMSPLLRHLNLEVWTLLTKFLVDDEQSKVVYIYAVGSPFEVILNKYMSNYNRGVDPSNPIAFLGNKMLANASNFSLSMVSSS